MGNNSERRKNMPVCIGNNYKLSRKANVLQSAIGQHFDSKPIKRRIAFCVAIAVVLTDVLIYMWAYGESVRLSLALIAFAIIVYLADGDLPSLGLRPQPKQGWIPWVWISARISCVIAVCVIAGLGAWQLMGNELPTYNHNPAYVSHLFLHMCVVAPVLEEIVYRVVVCLPLVSMIGFWKTIAINGILFASLHFVYGNPSPENLVGGFFLAWVYLKSETILLPLMFHSIGNFVALCCQLAASYYLHPTG